MRLEYIGTLRFSFALRSVLCLGIVRHPDIEQRHTRTICHGVSIGIHMGGSLC